MWCEAQLRLCFPTSFFGCRISPQRAGVERGRACDHLTPFFRRSTAHLEPQSDARIIKKVPAGNATPARVLALPQNVAHTTHVSVSDPHFPYPYKPTTRGAAQRLDSKRSCTSRARLQ